jgi:hypothetical protein
LKNSADRGKVLISGKLKKFSLLSDIIAPRKLTVVRRRLLRNEKKIITKNGIPDVQTGAGDLQLVPGTFREYDFFSL